MKINAEMQVHTTLCTHAEPENVLIIDTNAEINNELKKHVIQNITTINATDDLVNAISDIEDASIDAVIINKELSSSDELFLARVSKILKPRGVVSFKSASFYDDALKSTLTKLPRDLIIAMPHFIVREDGVSSFVFASKKYHPTADIILQRSDLLDGLDYYNSEIQLSSFILPQDAHKRFTGYARR